MAKKAIIFTLDALLAVLAGGLLITSTYFLLSETARLPVSRQNLFKVSLDSLAVLEKDQTLRNAVQGASAEGLEAFLEATPSNICGNITIYTSQSSPVLSAQKANCTIVQPVVSRRIFSAGFASYYAEARMGFD